MNAIFISDNEKFLDTFVNESVFCVSLSSPIIIGIVAVFKCKIVAFTFQVLILNLC